MDPREIELVRVANVHVTSRLREPSADAINRLVKSIEEIGLQTPIHVRFVEEMEIDGKLICNVPVLVAGATRLAAVKKLGWEKIEAIALRNDDIEAQLWEIDENLARAELSPAQIAEHMARRKALWERRVSGQVVSKPQGGRPDGFALDTAKATGQDKRTINRSVARGEKIAPDVLQAVQGTKLDTGSALDKIARLPVAEQRRAVSQVRLPDEPLNEFEATQKQVSALMAAWNKAGPEAREQFFARIDRPTFDNTRAGRSA